MKRDTTLLCGLSLLAAVSGCSRPAQPPTRLAQQITQCDRIVATNQYRASSLIITGAEVGSIGKAVSSAAHDKNAYDAVFDCEVQFYAGTNLLTAIRLQDRAFWAEGTQYSDDTGVLKAFYNNWAREKDTR